MPVYFLSVGAEVGVVVVVVVTVVAVDCLGDSMMIEIGGCMIDCTIEVLRY